MSISWLVPVRDGAQWLGDAVASALHECGEFDEVIVVDDGSTDSPKTVLPADERIRFFSHEPLGIVAALENGRRQCQNQYIARLDADDVTLPGRIRVQVAAMEADPRLAAVGGRAELIWDHGPRPKGMLHYVDWVNGLEDLHRALLIESPLFHPAVLMRADILDAVGGYRDGDLPEDYDLWLRMDQAGFRLASVPDVVVRIRDRPNRLTRTDERYRKEAFDNAKRAWLAAGPLRRPRRVVIWGAGRTGKRWLRWMLAQGHSVPAVVDVHCRTERQGVPVIAPEALPEVDADILFVAVGTRGARATIRAFIDQLRPDWKEGRDWWALA